MKMYGTTKKKKTKGPVTDKAKSLLTKARKKKKSK